MLKINKTENRMYDWWLGLGNITRRALRIIICVFVSVMPGLFFHISTGPFWRKPDIHIIMGAVLGFFVSFVFSILWTRAARYAKALIRANEELATVNKMLNEERKKLAEANIVLEEEKIKLAEANKLLEQLCCLDPLTGLNNRAYTEKAALKAMKHAGRENGYMFSVMLDVDNLKYVNDTYGHEAGDEIIIKTAAVIRRIFRDNDHLIRIGGDEFEAIGVTDSPEKFTQSLKEKIIPFPIVIEEETIVMSLSYGCAFEKIIGYSSNHNESDSDLQTYATKLHQGVFNTADAHMYAMKRAKKNSPC